MRAVREQAGLGSLVSLDVWMWLLLPKCIVVTLAHLQTVILVTLFCVCAQLEARIWLKIKRRIPEVLTEK